MGGVGSRWARETATGMGGASSAPLKILLCMRKEINIKLICCGLVRSVFICHQIKNLVASWRRSRRGQLL